MIGMASKNAGRAPQLFGQHGAGEERQAVSHTPQQVTAIPAIESALGITPNTASSSATAKIGVR